MEIVGQARQVKAVAAPVPAVVGSRVYGWGLFYELKLHTSVIRIFPNEKNACSLSTAMAIRVSGDCDLRRYLDMESYRAWK